MATKRPEGVALIMTCRDGRTAQPVGCHTGQGGSVFRRLIVGACAAIMILSAVGGWSQEEEESAAALYAAILGIREMQEEMLKSLEELRASSNAVSQEDLAAKRVAEEDISATLNWATTQLTELEKRYQEALNKD